MNALRVLPVVIFPPSPRAGAQGLMAGPAASWPTTSATYLFPGLRYRDSEPLGDVRPL